MTEKMSVTFAKMVPVKSYQHVVEQVESAILDGSFQQGDRLPSEMKLKDMFGTSRGTVREALRVLEQKGLVTIRTGVKGGATVKEANTEAISDGMALLIRQQQVSLEKLAEFREFLEGFAAEKAAERCDQEQIGELNDILQSIEDHVSTHPEGWDEFHRLDAIFHRRLAKMADNSLVEANLVTIHENIHGYFQKYLPFSRELLLEDVDDLRRIAAAVGRGDGQAAGEATRFHIARFSAMMEKSEKNS